MNSIIFIKKQQILNVMKLRDYIGPTSLLFLLNSIAFGASAADRTATITSGSQQLTGSYELSNATQSQSTIKITGNNTVVTAGDDVSISVTGKGNAITLTNGSLTLDGTSVRGSNNASNSSSLISNTNGKLNVSNTKLTTDTLNTSGIQAIGSNSVTNITDSHLTSGYGGVSGSGGAKVTINSSQIDSFGNYGIILNNNATLTGVS